MNKRFPCSYNLMITGSARHGKDTATEFIAEQTNMTFESSSRIACEMFIFDALKIKYGYTTPEECWLDRLSSNTMRAIWYDLIKEYNTPCGTRLMEDIYAQHDIYSGIRCGEELAEGQAKGLIDLTIWIDASKRVPIEPQTSMTVTKEQADIVILNNETESVFLQKLYKICLLIKPQINW